MSSSSSSSSDHKVEGLLITAAYILLWELVRHRYKTIHFEDAYWCERRGRTRVEKEMRNLANVQLNTSSGFFVQPIANIQSCYRQCVGTPRQGALVPSSRASLILTNNMSPAALDGLEEFSHVWLTFKFHLNTNTLKEAKAFSGVLNNTNNFTFKAKIVPPMLKEKKGVLATRSPHRPNPVGVTLAKIESVNIKTKTIHLSCCDLVDGTPILDIKPYVPAYDTVPTFRVPFWIAETIDTRNTVTLAPHLSEQVLEIEGKLREYRHDSTAFLTAITETLQAEVRSKFQTKRRMEDSLNGIQVEVPFDNTMVYYNWRKEREIEILDVKLTSSLPPLPLYDDNASENISRYDVDEESEESSTNNT